MKTRSSKSRLLELTRWVSKHRTAKWQEFVEQAGGTRSQFYHLRENLGINKKRPEVSEGLRAAHQRKREEANAVLMKRQEENEAYLAGKPEEPPIVSEPVAEPKKEEVVEITAPDFIWSEMELMQRKIGDVSLRLNQLMRVAQARDSDQKRMMRDLINENTTLRVESNGLRQQVIELTEMINGAPV